MAGSDEDVLRRPDEAKLESLAEDLGLALMGSEREDYHELVDSALAGLEEVERAPSFDAGLEPETLGERERGYRPSPEEDPLNAWITKGDVQGEGDGPLADLTVGVKDSIAVAGYEMTAGSTVLKGFVPRIDATVVSRLLKNGATIPGKLNMESFAWSGRGDISDFGPVENPHGENRLPGGSSSGSGAAPANGECDVALGTDQAGSVRIPSSWCGLVGIKPTHGLVPYTGALPLEVSLDHIGPMAPSVDLVARTLDAIAGVDTTDGIQLDQRQPPTLDTDAYAESARADVDSLSIAVLEEGFGWEFSEAEVDEAVREAVASFEELGVTCDSVSVPVHRQGTSAWAAIASQGGTRLLQEGGVGTNHTGWTWTRLARVVESSRKARTDELPPTVKRSLLAGKFLTETYGAEPYAKARNTAMEARTCYDDVLAEYDAILLPTTVTRAFEKPEPFDRVQALEKEIQTIVNTCVFNITGHPAISVPCAKPDGLPVGAMLVGSHFDEVTLLSLATAFEDATEWTDR